mgnify:CR=1 FL=1
MAFLVSLLLGLLFAVISFLLAPKPKTPKPPEVQDLEDPTADFREIPIVFGTLTVKGVNVLWFGDKSYREYEISVPEA